MSTVLDELSALLWPEPSARSEPWEQPWSGSEPLRWHVWLAEQVGWSHEPGCVRPQRVVRAELTVAVRLTTLRDRVLCWAWPWMGAPR